MLLTKIKKERTKKRRGSPGGESSGSEDSSNSSTSPIVATTRLTLSERFGKIAQWSADRERRDIENMRITKTGGDLKVMIEEDDFLYGSPPRRYRYNICICKNLPNVFYFVVDSLLFFRAKKFEILFNSIISYCCFHMTTNKY